MICTVSIGTGSPCCFSASRYACIASLTFFMSSCLVFPSVAHPGRSGTLAIRTPSSSFSIITLYLSIRLHMSLEILKLSLFLITFQHFDGGGLKILWRRPSWVKSLEALHLASAQIASRIYGDKVDYFVTLDEDILKKHTEIRNLIDSKVVSPAALKKEIK